MKNLRVRSIEELPVGVRPAGLAPAVAAPALPTKYRNIRCEEDGERFDSKLELRYYRELKLRHAAREVLWWTRQVPFILEGGVRYRCDFLVVLAAGGVEVVDCKGHDTRGSLNKRRQVKARYGINVLLWPSRT